MKNLKAVQFKIGRCLVCVLQFHDFGLSEREMKDFSQTFVLHFQTCFIKIFISNALSGRRIIRQTFKVHT